MRPAGTWALGPACGTIGLRTDVEGKAARMGHRLLIGATDWSGEAVAGPDGLAVSVRAGVAGLTVLSGEGGAKALSEKDRRTIGKTIVELLGPGDITFTSIGVEDRGDLLEVTGNLTVAGVERPVLWRMSATEVEGGVRLAGSFPVIQSKHGVTPYSTMLGQLRVADIVNVELDLVLAT